MPTPPVGRDAGLVELLAQLEQRWLDAGAPVAEHLSPGLDEEVIVDTLAFRGLAAPVEVRTWFGWRNGPDDDGAWDRAGSDHSIWQVAPDCAALSLDRALAHRDNCLAFRSGVRDVPPEDFWRVEWLPLALTSYGSILVADCGVGDAAPSPVSVVDWERADFSWLDPVTTSIAALVELFVAALDHGRWHYDQEHREWERDPSRLPAVGGLLGKLI